MNYCHRCPNKPMGCFPYCEYPSASWATDNTTPQKPPEWVVEWDRLMDERARHRIGGYKL